MGEIDDKARRANAILTDPLFEEAVEKTRKGFIDTIKDSQPNETSKREAAYFSLVGCDAFITELQNYIVERKVAANR